MTYVPTLKKMYKEQVVPALVKEFGYSSVMQVPVLEKIVINQASARLSPIRRLSKRRSTN